MSNINNTNNIINNIIKSEKKSRAKDAMLVLIYFLLFLFFSWRVPFVVSALVIGFYFFILLDVPYEFVFRKTRKKWLAWSAYILVITFFAYAIASFFPTTIQQIYSIFEHIRNIGMNNETSALPSWIIKVFDELRANISNIMIKGLNNVINMLPTIFTMITLLVVTMIGIKNIKSYFKKKIDIFFLDDPSYGEKFVTTFFYEVTKYIKGQVLVSLITSVLTVVGLLFIGVPSAINLGVLTFLGGFFPFVGFLISAIPMYLLAITTGGLKSLIFLTILLLLVNQAESWIYGPKIQGKNLKLHWFVILIGIFIFGSLIGFVGVLIALPVLLFVRNYWKFYVKG